MNLFDDRVLILVVDVPAADNFDAGQPFHLLCVRQHLVEGARFGVALEHIAVGAVGEDHSHG